MNVIVIYSDTLRPDHIGANGNDAVKTPNLDRLASESVVFERAYTANFPTVPNRFDLLTGRFSFTHFEWGPLPGEAVSLGEVLAENGCVTQLIHDTPWISAHGYNFSRGFSGWKWIRGQETDRYSTAPRDPELPFPPEKLRMGGDSLAQYLRNVSRRRREEDYFPAMTMREAARWLEENRDSGDFLLWVDTFDPHEPWDPPGHYLAGYGGPAESKCYYPRYDFCEAYGDEEVQDMRRHYAGEVTLVDTWVGYLLRRLEELRLAEDTAVIFTSDHGMCLGEHNFIGKSIIREKSTAHVPLWEVISHIPLFVRVPGVKPRRTSALVQTPDITATVYDLAGVEPPETVQGVSLLPVVEMVRDDHRDVAVSSSSLVHGTKARRFSTVTFENWQLIYGGEKTEPADAASATVDSQVRTEQPLYRPGEPGVELYNLADDPAGETDVAADHPDVVEELHARYVEFLRKMDCPADVLENRLRLPEGWKS